MINYRSRSNIKNRVNDLAAAEGDIMKGLADVEAQRRTLEDDLYAIRLERYELTEAAALGPLFHSQPAHLNTQRRDN